MSRRGRWALGLLVLALISWLAVCAFVLVGAAGDVRSAKDAAAAARRQLDAQSVLAGSTLPDVRRAERRFASARRATANPVLAPARLLPVVGRQLRSVRSLAEAAEDALDASADALQDLRATLREPPSDAPQRLLQIQRVAQTLRRTERRLTAAQDLGPRKGLLSPLADARNELASELHAARQLVGRAAAGTNAASSMLAGPSRYLLVAANTAEMRAGAGAWLSGGILTMEQGRLRLDDVAPLYRTADPPDGAVPVEDVDLRERWSPHWDITSNWPSLMVSPRFAASAPLGVAMWRAAGRPEALDGVLLLDPLGLAEIMRATGPVTVGGRTFDASNIVPYLLNEQYRSFEYSSSARRDAQEDVAKAVFDALDAGRWSMDDLAESFATAAAGRHLLGWSQRSIEQDGFEAAGVDGDLRPNSVLVSVLNRGGNKLDYFLRTTADLTVAPGDGSALATLRVRLRNTAPPGQPRYVSGPPPGGTWGPGEYLGVVTVDVPGPATEVTIAGRPAVVAGSDGAATVVGTEVRIPPGTAQELVVTFRLPVEHGVLRIEPSARWPQLRWSYGGNRWKDRTVRVVKF